MIHLLPAADSREGMTPVRLSRTARRDRLPSRLSCCSVAPASHSLRTS